MVSGTWGPSAALGVTSCHLPSPCITWGHPMSLVVLDVPWGVTDIPGASPALLKSLRCPRYPWGVSNVPGVLWLSPISPGCPQCPQGVPKRPWCPWGVSRGVPNIPDVHGVTPMSPGCPQHPWVAPDVFGVSSVSLTSPCPQLTSGSYGSGSSGGFQGGQITLSMQKVCGGAVWGSLRGFGGHLGGWAPLGGPWEGSGGVWGFLEGVGGPLGGDLRGFGGPWGSLGAHVGVGGYVGVGLGDP